MIGIACHDSYHTTSGTYTTANTKHRLKQLQSISFPERFFCRSSWLKTLSGEFMNVCDSLQMAMLFLSDLVDNHSATRVQHL